MHVQPHRQKSSSGFRVGVEDPSGAVEVENPSGAVEVENQAQLLLLSTCVERTEGEAAPEGEPCTAGCREVAKCPSVQ